MKKCLFMIFTTLCGTANCFAQTQWRVSGIVKDESGMTVEYATAVVLHLHGAEVTGTVSDEQGCFSFMCPEGDYTLCVTGIGYERNCTDLSLRADYDAGDVVLNANSTLIEGVVVTAQTVTRQADRFIINVAGTTAAIGKTALELLSTSPGVWIDNERISINGNSGTRVMIDDRFVEMSTEELLDYLRSINAEDITRIEIIPISGAEYDAATKGGIIKISTKRKRDEGVDGDMQFRLTNDGRYFSYAPAVNVNYRNKRFTAYTNLYYSGGNNRFLSQERTTYFLLDNVADAETLFKDEFDYYRAKVGLVYDISDNQTIGGEFTYSKNVSEDNTYGTSSLKSAISVTDNVSHYWSKSRSPRYDASLEYTLNLDTLGSSIKIMGSLIDRETTENGLNKNSAEYYQFSDPTNIFRSDSTYRSTPESDYKLYSATAALEYSFTSETQLKAGLKFNYNSIDNRTLFEGLDSSNSLWLRNDENSYVKSYTEQISAAYASLSTVLWDRVSVTAGLRGEYTVTKPRTQYVEQGVEMDVRSKRDYFDLFPSVSVMVPLGGQKDYFLSAVYSRMISRPGFWEMDPRRTQMSEYSYVVGNPDLKPSYTNDVSLTAVLKNKYSITVGAQFENDVVQQVSMLDENDDRILIYKTMNVNSTQNYYLSVNAPVTLTKWWTLNVNATGMRQEIRVSEEKRTAFLCLANVTSAMTLPAKFNLELTGHTFTGGLYGNFKMKSMTDADISLKKRFAKDAFTASFSVSNVFDSMITRAEISEADFRRNTRIRQNIRTFSLSLRYNFKAGKDVKARTVESDNEESSRIGK